MIETKDSIILEYRDEIWNQLQKAGICKDNEVKMLETLYAFLSENAFAFHHKSMRRGYLSRRVKAMCNKYKGHFGIGFSIEVPTFEGTQYHEILYFTFGNKVEGDENDD